MEDLPLEIITIEICKYLIDIDKQILRRVCKQYKKIFSYKKIKFNDEFELVHLKRYKLQWNDSTPAYSALNGQLDCLKYTHENGCVWNENTNANAARNGHLDCVKTKICT